MASEKSRDFFIPPRLETQMRGSGPAGSEWLKGLPGQIAALEQEWKLRVGVAITRSGTASWVAPAEMEDGSVAILKVGFPHEEARFEANALRHLNGCSAVHLLRSSDDGFSLLLERCLPGTDLWSMGEEAGNAIASQILTRLWQQSAPPPPFPSLEVMVDEWWRQIPQTAVTGGYETELVSHALALGRTLVNTQPERALLHGDFHPGNVLAAEREPWLMIDPKPLVGERAYDLAQWLANRSAAAIQSADPVGILRQQIIGFAGNLGLDPARIAGWAFVKSIGWDWGSRAASLFYEVAGGW